MNDETPRFHQSTAHMLLSRSPLHAWHYHPDLGRGRREYSDAMDRGNLVDRMLLGVGPEIVVVDAKDWRTNEAKEKRDHARASGKLPILGKEYIDLMGVVEGLRLRLEERGVRFTGQTQVSVKWTAPNGVECEGRIDHLLLSASKGKALIYDLKTTENAHPDAITRSMVTYGYDIQRAAYVEAIETLHPEFAGRTKMVFLFCETKAPFAVTLAEATGTMRALGEHKWRRACEIWKACLESDDWPAYSTDVVPIEAKPWQLTEALGEGEGIEL